ncbi:hypothetical protein [Streptomyces sp. NPDC008001]|uniref:hypothetical protein n=1 Tax=Streptomyces sp. NPDC008001 TaxID=3364804 RepID=UPI0036F033CF
MALSVLALVVSSAAWSPAAQAHTGGHRSAVLCQGPSDSTYDPPLTLEARGTRVHTDAQYSCSVAPGRIVSATGSLDGVSPEASCDGQSSPRITEVVKYADGAESLLVYDHGTTTRTLGFLDVMLSGRVVKGRGEGQSARRDVLLAAPKQLPTDCFSSGVRGNSGQAQLEIQP